MKQKNQSTKPPSTCFKGRSAEVIARAWLEEKGYRFLEANFRWRGGEIDLVMGAPLDGGSHAKQILVFVEVRSALEASQWLRHSIGFQKKQRLMKTAFYYLQRRPWARHLPFRFDLVWLEGSNREHWTNVLLS